MGITAHILPEGSTLVLKHSYTGQIFQSKMNEDGLFIEFVPIELPWEMSEELPWEMPEDKNMTQGQNRG